MCDEASYRKKKKMEKTTVLSKCLFPSLNCYNSTLVLFLISDDYLEKVFCLYRTMLVFKKINKPENSCVVSIIAFNVYPGVIAHRTNRCVRTIAKEVSLYETHKFYGILVNLL
jgi:hypothetical protein